MLSCNRCWRRLYTSLASPVALRPAPLTSFANSTSRLQILAASGARNYAALKAQKPSGGRRHKEQPYEPEPEIEMDLPERLEDISNPVKLQSVVRLYIAKNQTMRALDLALSAVGKIETVGSFNAILMDMMANKRSHDAWKVFNDMKKRQVWPNEYTITTMINGFANNIDQGQHIWKRALSIYKSLDAENSKVTRSIIHTNAILKVLAKAGQLSEMWEIVGELPDSGENSPDAITYTIIFNALKNAKGDHTKSIPDAKRLWDGIVRRWDNGEMDVDDHMAASMGRVLLTSKKEEDHELILDIIEYAFGITRPVPRKHKATEEHYVPKNITKPLRATRNIFSLVIEACGKLRLMDAAPLYWNQFEKKSRIRPDIENYHSLLRYYRSVKDGPAAEALLRKIASPNNNLELDQKSFYIAMSACRRSGRSQSYETAVKILNLHRNNTPEGVEKGDPKLLAMFMEVALKIGDQGTIKRAIKQFRDYEFPAPEENKLFRDFPIRTAAVRAAQANEEKRDSRIAAKRILLWKLGKSVLGAVNAILDETVKNVTTSPEERRMLQGFRNETIEWMDRRLGGEEEVRKDQKLLDSEETDSASKPAYEVQQIDAWENTPESVFEEEEASPRPRRGRQQADEDSNPDVPNWYKSMTAQTDRWSGRGNRKAAAARRASEKYSVKPKNAIDVGEPSAPVESDRMGVRYPRKDDDETYERNGDSTRERESYGRSDRNTERSESYRGREEGGDRRSGYSGGAGSNMGREARGNFGRREEGGDRRSGYSGGAGFSVRRREDRGNFAKREEGGDRRSGYSGGAGFSAGREDRGNFGRREDGGDRRGGFSRDPGRNFGFQGREDRGRSEGGFSRRDGAQSRGGFSKGGDRGRRENRWEGRGKKGSR